MTILVAIFLYWSCWQVRPARARRAPRTQRPPPVPRPPAAASAPVPWLNPLPPPPGVAPTAPPHPQLFDCLRKGLIAQHPLFSFAASQHAAAAAAAGHSMEVGGAGPYGQFGAPVSAQAPGAGYQVYPPGYPQGGVVQGQPVAQPPPRF